VSGRSNRILIKRFVQVAGELVIGQGEGGS
jgi:hypothetical protein